MKIINETSADFLNDFVEDVLDKFVRKFNTCEIKDYDLDRVYLSLDGEEFDIRTWDIREVNNTLLVRWTLFQMMCGEDGTGGGKEMIFGHYVRLLDK
jgi:hypothetical protein